jgi:hypothetical protein
VSFSLAGHPVFLPKQGIFWRPNLQVAIVVMVKNEAKLSGQSWSREWEVELALLFPGLNLLELDYAAFGAGASSMLVMCRMAHSMYFCAYESGSETPTPTSMVFFLTNAKS